MAIFTAIGTALAATFFAGSTFAAAAITPLVGTDFAEFNPADLK